jgi:glycerol kinase
LNLAASVIDNGGVYFVSALTGLGAPYWDPMAQSSWNYKRNKRNRAQEFNLVRNSFQVYDLAKAIEADLAKKEGLMAELQLITYDAI